MAVGEGAGADGLGPGARSKVPGRKSDSVFNGREGGGGARLAGASVARYRGSGKRGGKPRVDTRG